LPLHPDLNQLSLDWKALELRAQNAPLPSLRNAGC
jgi:hypothetical protein